MKTILSLSPAAQVETECLVTVVLDRTAQVQPSDLVLPFQVGYARQALGLAADAKEAGVLAREPQNEVAAGGSQPVIAVGDAALEGHELGLDESERRRQPLEEGVQWEHPRKPSD